MRRTPVLALVAAVVALPALAVGAVAQPGPASGASSAVTPAAGPGKVRFATFNASLNRSRAGELVEHLSTPDNQQARNVAETIQRAAPDVVLVNEFDYDPAAVDLFRDNYLEVSQNGAAPVDYPYAFVAPVNTGVPSGFDLNNNGVVAGGDDAFGFGLYPGQFGMVVYSRFPIDTGAVRTFQHFLWKDLPGAQLPDDPATPTAADWYSPEELDVFRLSSKSHWDVPIQGGGRTVHFLVSHPTPPVFDGPEDRNGTRNFDEIRFWADYVQPGARSAYVYDDEGGRGGLPAGAAFVIAGDQNSDPLDGDSLPGAAQQLIDHPLVNDTQTPSSDGGPWAAATQGGANAAHESDPAHDTADFDDRVAFNGPGNLRADYVLPSKSLRIAGSGIFWPTSEQDFFYLTGPGFPAVTSDHRLVWVDVRR